MSQMRLQNISPQRKMIFVERERKFLTIKLIWKKLLLRLRQVQHRFDKGGKDDDDGGDDDHDDDDDGGDHDHHPHLIELWILKGWSAEKVNFMSKWPQEQGPST